MTHNLANCYSANENQTLWSTICGARKDTFLHFSLQVATIDAIAAFWLSLLH